jgi:hypothetical protein
MPRIARMALALLVPMAAAAQDDGRVFRWAGTPASGAQVRLYNVNGNVRVVRGDRDVEVTATRDVRRGDPMTVRFEARRTDGGDIVVCALWGPDQRCTDDGIQGSWRSRSGGPEISVLMEVRVPAGVRTLARSVNGGIDVRGVRGPVNVETVNGGVTLESVVGTVQATTVNGSIDARLVSLAGDDPLRVRTVNGDISLALPEDAAANVELSTVNGSVNSELPLTLTSGRTPRRWMGTLRGGGRRVTLGTTNGSVRLLRASL